MYKLKYSGTADCYTYSLQLWFAIKVVELVSSLYVQYSPAFFCEETATFDSETQYPVIKTNIVFIICIYNNTI